MRGGQHRAADCARADSRIIRPWRERFAAAPPAPENPTPVEAMAYRLRTPKGKKLYALRKQTPEPVFGIIKSVMGFRQFLLRGLDNVRGEWSLVTMAWNMKRMFALSGCLPLVDGLKAATTSPDTSPIPPRSASSDPGPQVNIGILQRLGFVQTGKMLGDQLTAPTTFATSARIALSA